MSMQDDSPNTNDCYDFESAQHGENVHMFCKVNEEQT